MSKVVTRSNFADHLLGFDKVEKNEDTLSTIVERMNATKRGPKVMVMGVGGAGCNIINKFVDDIVPNVELVAVNTNKQELDNTDVTDKILIGEKLTRGLGSGSNPEIGEKSAEESIEEINSIIKDVDVLFLIGGMGGGTATGALPVIAEAAKEKGVLTNVVVTKPLKMEQRLRMRRAESGIVKLKDTASALIVFSNDNVFSDMNKNSASENSVNCINEELCRCIIGFIDVICKNGGGALDSDEIESVIKNKNFAEIYFRPELLVLNEDEIHSLSQLKNEILELEDISDLKEAVDNEVLYKWLSEHYYEEEADGIRLVRSTDSNWLRKVVETFDIPYNSLSGTIQHEDEDYKERKKLIEKLAGDDKKKIPDNLSLVVVNQEELAKLIDAGEETIYLCEGEFNVPIGKNGITYYGIANPTIENAYTKELYKKAGINIVDIELPEKIDTDKEEYALKKAIENGYDTFYDEHNPLACKVHRALYDTSYYYYYRLEFDTRAVIKDYTFKSEAKKAIKYTLSKTYDSANALFNKNNKECIVKDVVDFYTSKFQKVYGEFKGVLNDYCKAKGYDEEMNKIDSIVGSCKQFLEKELYDDLTDNEYFYEMYDFSYFVDQVEVQKLLTEYTMSSDVLNARAEMEKDANEKATSLHRFAKERFNKLVDELTNVFDVIGKDLSDSDKDETISDYLKRELKNESK